MKYVHLFINMCTSDLQNMCIRLKSRYLQLSVQPTYSRSDTLILHNPSDQQQLEAAENPRKCRSEVSF